MKKFANVFELLAEADANGRIAEIKNPLDHSWSQLGLLANLNTLRARFNRGEIRLKPKFKTVEGYIMLTPCAKAGPAHLPFYADNPFVYADKECSPARRTEGDIIAKITFEVEE